MRAESLHPALRHGLTALAGAFLALALYRFWTLEARYFYAGILAIVLVSLSMPFLHRFSDFLLVAFLGALPLAAFSKYLLLDGVADDRKGILRYSGALSVGPLDLLLLAVIGMWLIRIFVTRQEPLPRLVRADVLPFLLLAAYFLSIPGALEPKYAVFGTVSLAKYVLVYFYISRNFQREHVPWLFAAVGVALLLEGALAIIQYSTGKFVGLALDRGRGEIIHEQYAVPGIEHRNRATGTVSESHTFGLYVAMLVQYAFVLVYSLRTQQWMRWIATPLLLLGLVCVVISFSRAAWLSCAGALLLAWAVRLYWGERQLLTVAVAAPLVLAPLLPWMVQIFVERFATAGGDLIAERFDQFPIALAMWRDHFVFGCGVGNYMDTLSRYNVVGALALPVHNVFLWAAAETGIVGVTALFGTIFAAIARAWRVVMRGSEPLRRVALALVAGLTAYLLDGLTDPLYREPVVFMMFWVTIGLSVAVHRIHREETAPA